MTVNRNTLEKIGAIDEDYEVGGGNPDLSKTKDQLQQQIDDAKKDLDNREKQKGAMEEALKDIAAEIQNLKNFISTKEAEKKAAADK